MNIQLKILEPSAPKFSWTQKEFNLIDYINPEIMQGFKRNAPPQLEMAFNEFNYNPDPIDTYDKYIINLIRCTLMYKAKKLWALYKIINTSYCNYYRFYCNRMYWHKFHLLIMDLKYRINAILEIHDLRSFSSPQGRLICLQA